MTAAWSPSSPVCSPEAIRMDNRAWWREQLEPVPPTTEDDET